MALRDAVADGRALLETLEAIEAAAVRASSSVDSIRLDPAGDVSAGSGGGGSGGTLERGDRSGRIAISGGATGGGVFGLSADGRALVTATGQVARSVEALRRDLRGDGGAGWFLRGGL